MTTVFEDKCTDNLRETFLQKVIPAFIERHRNTRSAEIVAVASALLRMAGIGDADAARLAAAVMDRTRRSYRASFALTQDLDSLSERKKLFKGYDAIDGLTAQHRIGASLIVDGTLREWFDALVLRAIHYLDLLETSGT